MKKISKILLVFVVVALVLPAMWGCTDRSRELRVFNWDYFMHPEVFGLFEEYMLEHHGERVRVRATSFLSNEGAYREIAENRRDRDIVVPSDYMVARLRAGGYIQRLDAGIIASELAIHQELGQVSGTDFRALLRDYIYTGANTFDEGLLYSVPFLWGTLGIMFNRNTYAPDRVPGSAVYSWNHLFEPAGNVFMKEDQVRDNYTAAMLYSFSAELRHRSENLTNFSNSAYIELMEAIFNNFEAGPNSFWNTADFTHHVNFADPFEHATIVLRALRNRPNTTVYWEMDQAMFDMQSERLHVNAHLGLAWSTDAGFVMNENPYAPVADMLYYVVPEEGSNLWINNLVIPARAGNPRLANKFIAFSLREDIAKLNTLSTGSPAANQEAMIELEDYLRNDSNRFDGTSAGFKDMLLGVMFPEDSVMERLFIMSDFGARFHAANIMWTNVMA